MGVAVGLGLVLAAGWSIGGLAGVGPQSGATTATDASVESSGAQPSLPPVDSGITGAGMDENGGALDPSASSSQSSSASPELKSASSATSPLAAPRPAAVGRTAGSGSGSGHTPTSGSTAGTASPAPTAASPLPTCQRFLWWCG